MGLFKLHTADDVFSLKETENRFTLTPIDFTTPPIGMTCDLTSILCDSTNVSCDAA